jgi:hypothetical protein
VSGSLPGGSTAPALQPGHFDGISDERLEAELRAAGLLVTGSGGHGIGGPDRSGGGGGDGDGWDDEEWPQRRRHSRAVRVMALATATLLALGTAGAWVSLIIEASHPPFPAQVVVTGVTVPHPSSTSSQPAVTASNTDHAAAAVGNGTGSAGASAPAVTWHLGLTVTNRSGAAGTPECLVLIDGGGQTGGRLVVFPRTGNGASQNRSVSVTLHGTSSTSLPEVETACGPR